MDPALKLNVLIAHPSYGGNGGLSSEHPHIREWAVETIIKAKADPRVGWVESMTMADTPITMVRNKFVTAARARGAHVLLMVDSDQSPNKHKGEHWWKPFWDVAFDEIYKHYQRGPLVIGAPYCGPPDGGENVYIFQFDNMGVRGDETLITLDQYTRAEASKMTGVTEVAALPTGMIMCDMRIFDLLEPSSLRHDQILDKYREGELTKVEAMSALHDGWFFYEWKDQYADEKASTEDVAATRNMAFQGQLKLGYNPVRCAWDCWIGHHKPWNVGKPQKFTVENISAKFREAVERGNSTYDAMTDMASDWQEEIKRGHVLPPVPKDFPREILGALSDQAEITSRDVFGREAVTVMEMTPMEHLEALRALCESESRRLGRKLRVVEVGSWVGESALAMVDFCDELICVDNWQGPSDEWAQALAKVVGGAQTIKKLFEWNTRDLSQITVIEGDSREVGIGRDRNLYADIIVIDADHTYESTLGDIDAWRPHLRPGGVMVGHDYKTVQYPGVEKAVHDRFAHVQPYGMTDAGGYWLVRLEEGNGAVVHGHS